MYEQIVVPLDGSLLAEAILPYVRLLASAYSSQITLLRAIDQKEDVEAGDAENYMRSLSKSLGGVRVNQVVRIGHPAEVIAEESDRNREGALIAMSTHGRSGVGRWAVGSVTDKVLHLTNSSLLVVRPGQTVQTTGTASLTRVLVPLDGSEMSERALPTACILSGDLNLGMVLTEVVFTAQYAMAGTWTGGYTAYLDGVEEEARNYLMAKEIELKSQGRNQVESHLMRGDPASQILDLAARYDNCLVVMATKGRSGVGRALLGSVADRVACSAVAPVLIVGKE